MKMEVLRKKLGDDLVNMGIMPHLGGYGYIIRAIIYCMQAPNQKTMAKVYAAVAGTSNKKECDKVARQIRFAIQCGFKSGKLTNFNNIYRVHGIDNRYPPNNHEMIALFSERLSLHMFEETLDDAA